jgi:hypothetical protein
MVGDAYLKGAYEQRKRIQTVINGEIRSLSSSAVSVTFTRSNVTSDGLARSNAAFKGE